MVGPYWYGADVKGVGIRPMQDDMECITLLYFVPGIRNQHLYTGERFNVKMHFSLLFLTCLCLLYMGSRTRIRIRGGCPGGNRPRGSCSMRVIVLWGGCPQGSCPRGSCPRGSCPVTL